MPNPGYISEWGVTDQLASGRCSGRSPDRACASPDPGSGAVRDRPQRALPL